MYKPVWSDQEWLDGRSFIDPNILPWKGGAGPNLAGTEYWSKWNWSGLESIPISDDKKIIVCMSPFNPREYSQAGSTDDRFSPVDINGYLRIVDLLSSVL